MYWAMSRTLKSVFSEPEIWGTKFLWWFSMSVKKFPRKRFNTRFLEFWKIVWWLKLVLTNFFPPLSCRMLDGRFFSEYIYCYFSSDKSDFQFLEFSLKVLVITGFIRFQEYFLMDLIQEISLVQQNKLTHSFPVLINQRNPN